ncbi:NUDIX hydrolase [Psychromarinibacter sp. S121]|uniref:NUDIX hydrolase n=1 Tax=Psychromarinibacter sp. S121 TaxID=3415127 RepID=UPI003C7E29A2
MMEFARKTWRNVIAPTLRRPIDVQFGALCYRRGPDGVSVLLVQSSRGRWLLPKGWPIDGMDGAETAMQEAWEEAGVRDAQVEREPVGSYETAKRLDTGLDVPCVIHVYAAEVTRLSEDFPEADRRRVIWTSLDEAIARAGDPGIVTVLKTFRKRFV